MSTLSPARDVATNLPTAGRGARSGGGAWWIYLLLFLGILILVGPVVWMVLGSFKTTGELRQVPPPNAAQTAVA